LDNCVIVDNVFANWVGSIDEDWLNSVKRSVNKVINSSIKVRSWVRDADEPLELRRVDRLDSCGNIWVIAFVKSVGFNDWELKSDVMLDSDVWTEDTADDTPDVDPLRVSTTWLAVFDASSTTEPTEAVAVLMTWLTVLVSDGIIADAALVAELTTSEAELTTSATELTALTPLSTTLNTDVTGRDETIGTDETIGRDETIGKEIDGINEQLIVAE